MSVMKMPVQPVGSHVPTSYTGPGSQDRPSGSPSQLKPRKAKKTIKKMIKKGGAKK